MHILFVNSVYGKIVNVSKRSFKFRKTHIAAKLGDAVAHERDLVTRFDQWSGKRPLDWLKKRHGVGKDLREVVLRWWRGWLLGVNTANGSRHRHDCQACFSPHVDSPKHCRLLCARRASPQPNRGIASRDISPSRSSGERTALQYVWCCWFLFLFEVVGL